MIIGVPKEIKAEENRVGLVPAGVRTLCDRGHKVLVQEVAGEGSRIGDEEFITAGATMVPTAGDVYAAADMIVKVKEPLGPEFPLLREGQIVFCYLHLAPDKQLCAALLESGVIAVAYETIQLSDGSLPLLTPMSEVAGRVAVQKGAHLLEKTSGGRGVLLGGVPGVSRGRVTIIGAGTSGTAAAKIAIGMGAEVVLIDIDQRRLVYLDDVFGSRVTTKYSHAENIESSVRESHLVIGSVLIPGAKAPRLVTREMIAAMKPGSVVADIAIDQGGCFETSKVTSHANPTYEVDEVIHYCVPNIPSAVARTSTHALTNVTIGYALKLADRGFREAVAEDPALEKGVNLYKGAVTYDKVAEDLGYDFTPLAEVL